MASIHVQDKVSYVFFRWEGRLTEAEISAVAEKYYPQLGDRNKLYDMTGADLSGLTTEHLSAVAKTVATVQRGETFPKTAFVAGDMVSYSILSRYLLHVFRQAVPVEYRVFTDIVQAEKWLENK